MQFLWKMPSTFQKKRWKPSCIAVLMRPSYLSKTFMCYWLIDSITFNLASPRKSCQNHAWKTNQFLIMPFPLLLTWLKPFRLDLLIIQIRLKWCWRHMPNSWNNSGKTRSKSDYWKQNKQLSQTLSEWFKLNRNRDDHIEVEWFHSQLQLKNKCTVSLANTNPPTKPHLIVNTA